MYRTRGFTLIELIITMGILVIIVTTAAPTFNRVMLDIEVDSGVSKIRNILSYARAQAAQIQDDVIACSSNDSQTCTGESDWSVGVIVFFDEDNDGAFDPGPDANLCEAGEDCLYRVWDEGAPQGAVLEVTEEDENGNWASAPLIRFDDEASIDRLRSVVFELRVENCGAGDLRTLNVNGAGRTQVAPPGDC